MNICDLRNLSIYLYLSSLCCIVANKVDCMSASVHGEKLLTTLPICLESDQLFVFNLSKLSWEFKPFVVAVNSTFFKSPAVSSGRVSSTPKHTSTATLLLLLLMGKNTFQHWPVWWPERAAKILPPSCFFHQHFTPRLQQVLVPERFTIEACYTQLLPGAGYGINFLRSSE